MLVRTGISAIFESITASKNLSEKVYLRILLAQIEYRFKSV